MGRAQEHETKICQIQEQEVIVIPSGDISCAICEPRIPAVVFLEEFMGSAWQGPLALPGWPAHHLSTQLFLKLLEFYQNINFLLNPFKAQSSAACFLFHMPSDETVMRRGRVVVGSGLKVEQREVVTFNS